MFIVIEGQDATGKSAQGIKLKEYFEAQGKRVVSYAESGTASPNEFISTIARLNYGQNFGIENRTRALLYLVNRYEQWQKLAVPALENGDVVIITRNWLSTLIYSGYVGGVSRSLITKLHKLVMPEPYFHPDHIILLTIDEAKQAERLGLQSVGGASRSGEIWKSQGAAVQRKLNHAYLTVAKKFNIPTIDASGTIDEVFEKIKSELGLAN